MRRFHLFLVSFQFLGHWFSFSGHGSSRIAIALRCSQCSCNTTMSTMHNKRNMTIRTLNSVSYSQQPATTCMTPMQSNTLSVGVPPGQVELNRRAQSAQFHIPCSLDEISIQRRLRKPSGPGCGRAARAHVQIKQNRSRVLRQITQAE